MNVVRSPRAQPATELQNIGTAGLSQAFPSNSAMPMEAQRGSFVTWAILSHGALATQTGAYVLLKVIPSFKKMQN